MAFDLSEYVDEQQRLFVAVPLPAHVRSALIAPLDHYRHAIEREITPENLHLTLAFLGDVINPGQYIGRLKKPLPQQYVPTIRLTHVGRGRNRRQLWAFAENSASINRLRDELIERLKGMRFSGWEELRNREFIPHITVATLHKQMGGVGLADTPLPVSFSFSSAHLYRSLEQGGQRHYEAQETIRF